MKRTCWSLCSLVSALFLLAPSVQADIFFNLESPAPNQKVSGVRPIFGWAFSSTSPQPVTVRLRIGTEDRGIIPCCVERPDVADAYGSFPQAAESGFGQVINFSALSAGNHTLTVTVEDGVDTETRRHPITVVKPGGFDFLSALNLASAEARVEGPEIIIDGADAQEKESGDFQAVTLRLAWQQNTQTLDIVDSENIGPATVEESLRGQPSTQAQTEDGESTLLVSIENPLNQATIGGISSVSGWTFSETAGNTIDTVQVQIDGGSFGSAPCCSERPDVAAAFPDPPEEQTLLSGFSAPLNFNRLGSGEHAIAVEVFDSAGASRKAEQTATVVKLGDSEFLDQYDLSEAEASIVGGAVLQLTKVRVRDKATQQITTINASYEWRENCQCFVALAECGNGSIEPGEECDGGILGGETCSSLEFSSGTLGCDEVCQLDLTDCRGGPSVYVTNAKSNSVSVISTATNEVTSTITQVGREPRGIAVSPDGAVVYVTNFRDDTVSVINTATKTVTAPIEDVGDGPQGIAVSPDGTKIYIVNGLDDEVAVLNAATRTVATTLPVGQDPQDIALTPDGGRAYVTNFRDDSVTVLDLNTNTPVETIPVGDGPNGIGVSPDGTRVYAVNFGDPGEDRDTFAGSVSVIDTATNTVVDTLEVGLLPTRVAFAPDGSRAFVANALQFTVSVLDTETLEEVDLLFVAVDPFRAVVNELNDLVVTPNGKRLYVTLFGRNGAGSFLTVASALTGRIVAFVEVEEGPFGAVVVPPPS